MHWGRDIFGWPILRAPVTLDGALWAGDLAPRDDRLRASRPAGPQPRVDHDPRRRRRAPTPRPAAWFTPRLVPEPASSSERRELLVVRPVQIDSGRRHELSGSVELMFREPHPLAGITVDAERIETSVGFVIRVGDQVELL